MIDNTEWLRSVCPTIVTGLVEEYTGRPQIVIGLPVQVKVIAAFLAELSGLPTVVALGRRNSCS